MAHYNPYFSLAQWPFIHRQIPAGSFHKIRRHHEIFAFGQPWMVLETAAEFWSNYNFRFEPIHWPGSNPLTSFASESFHRPQLSRFCSSLNRLILFWEHLPLSILTTLDGWPINLIGGAGNFAPFTMASAGWHHVVFATILWVTTDCP